MAVRLLAASCAGGGQPDVSCRRRFSRIGTRARLRDLGGHDDPAGAGHRESSVCAARGMANLGTAAGAQKLVSESRGPARHAAPFSSGAARPAAVPEGLRDMLPTGAAPAHLQTLEQAGIRVSQGLRTGCNRLFYVTLAGDDGGETVSVEASDSFQNVQFRVPADALRPVLHRQADMPKPLYAATCRRPVRSICRSGFCRETRPWSRVRRRHTASVVNLRLVSCPPNWLRSSREQPALHRTRKNRRVSSPICRPFAPISASQPTDVASPVSGTCYRLSPPAICPQSSRRGSITGRRWSRSIRSRRS